MRRAAVILAAGFGTRMRSRKAKVLHEILGKPMINYVVENYRAAGVDKMVIVVGYQGEEVQKALAGLDMDLTFAWQHEQLGTAHAVTQAEPYLKDFSGSILVGYGDSPLYRPETIAGLVEHHEQACAECTVLSAIYERPFGYGRILRDEQGDFVGVVEEKDASPEQKQIREINTGVYIFSSQHLWDALAEVKANNAQKEYYLTDVPGIMRRKGYKVEIELCDDPDETSGINTRVQLAEATAIMKDRILERLMLSGVTIVDPRTTYIDPDVVIGQDTVIYPFTMIHGKTEIGENCSIGPGTRILNSRIANDVQIVQSIVIDSQLDANCSVGPFAHLRPGNVIGPHAHIGGFVEVKNSNVGERSKIPHLSYVGDSDVGTDVNMGAGSITCNYDGKKKHRTVIKDRAFVGSNSNLVAPVEVGEGAYIAAGSTITKDVPEGALAIGRARQVLKEGWAKKRREETC